jgi:hypothetical protein
VPLDGRWCGPPDFWERVSRRAVTVDGDHTSCRSFAARSGGRDDDAVIDELVDDAEEDLDVDAELEDDGEVELIAGTAKGVVDGKVDLTGDDRGINQCELVPAVAKDAKEVRGRFDGRSSRDEDSIAWVNWRVGE